MTDDRALRDHLARVLAWEEAHVAFDAAVHGIEPAYRGQRPSGLPYSPWELVEHIRRTQHDILEFCRNPDYQELSWPDDYWPASPEPPSASAWDESLAGYRRDRTALQAIAADPAQDLLAAVPQGSGQTYLRELLLVADHTAHHLGELIVVRRLLGIWR